VSDALDAALAELQRALDDERTARVVYQQANDERWHRINAWCEQVRNRLHELTGNVAGLSVHGGDESLQRARREAVSASPQLSQEKRAAVVAIVDELMSRL
jgi:hypothetical protein